MGFVLMAAVFVACEKAAPYDPVTQLEIDDALIAKFLKDSVLADSFTKHSSGLYYQIKAPGTGNEHYPETDTIFARYTLKLLRDSVLRDRFQDTTFKFVLAGYIDGWKTGTRLIQPGGTVRLIIPSALGFKDRPLTSPLIPPNSILDITLKIDKIKHPTPND